LKYGFFFKEKKSLGEMFLFEVKKRRKWKWKI